MALRIGSVILYPDAVFLPLAVAFLWTSTYRRLYPDLLDDRNEALLSLLIISIVGAAGGWLYGLAGSFNAPLTADITASLWQLRFGSFGGVFGVFVGMALCAKWSHRPVLAHLDALVPGVLVGASVARLACLFAGCCPGVTSIGTLTYLEFFRHWPAYDILALMVVWVVLQIPSISRQPLPSGVPLSVYLIAYGILRFLAEFVRDTPRFWGALTMGQFMCVAQVSVGAVLCLALLRRRKLATSYRRSAPPNPSDSVARVGVQVGQG